MGSPWRLREGFATSSRALHEDVAGAEGFSHTHGGFTKAPRAPPLFGNDSSDNDKPPLLYKERCARKSTEFASGSKTVDENRGDMGNFLVAQDSTHKRVLLNIPVIHTR